jgi:hypothetical protein
MPQGVKKLNSKRKEKKEAPKKVNNKSILDFY